MPRLQRRILTVVGESEQLPGVGFEARVTSVHPAKSAADEHGRRGTSTFGRERGEPVSVACCAALRSSAAEAETELTWEEPGVGSRAKLAVRRHAHRTGASAAVVRLETG